MTDILKKIEAYRFPVMHSPMTLASMKISGAQTPGPLGDAMRAFAENPADEAAIAVLVSPQMGLRRPDAERLLQRVKAANPDLKKADELVPEMLRQHSMRS